MAKPNIKSIADTKTALDPKAFKEAMLKMRQLFASKGIKSKADAFQLINQGFAEKRFNETDALALQHAASLVFDEDSFKLGQTLMDAKEKGMKLAMAKKQSRKHSLKGSAPKQMAPLPKPEAPTEEPPAEAAPAESAPMEEAGITQAGQ